MAQLLTFRALILLTKQVVVVQICHNSMYQKIGENDSLRPHEPKFPSGKPQQLICQLQARSNDLEKSGCPRLPYDRTVNKDNKAQKCERPQQVVEHLCV